MIIISKVEKRLIKSLFSGDFYIYKLYCTSLSKRGKLEVIYETFDTLEELRQALNNLKINVASIKQFINISMEELL